MAFIEPTLNQQEAVLNRQSGILNQHTELESFFIGWHF
ncbi:hypothetical protein EC835_101319 [Providencia alcalifaciens]|uniref:Uncharacterized protein n=1 Tax=Providencia alcalifaciens TaxID=126385 RepID=A0A4R3NYQ4_9GAMM|nr:hypothetical protein EC835_101319 [Providencia alcalifaciens]